MRHILKRCNNGGKKNWGDDISPSLFKFMSGNDPVLVGRKFKNPKRETIYLTIGSILGWACTNSIVWGTGYIRKGARVKGNPKKIFAVRGPLTKQQLESQGIKCPTVYGDPALLYPLVHAPDVKKKYLLGILPHYVDKSDPMLKPYRNVENIKIIDIGGGNDKLVEDICSCRYIISSSLHGVICADAYGIPSMWWKLSDKVRGKGFKFQDYFASVNRLGNTRIHIEKNASLENIISQFKEYEIDIDLNKLYESCPFKNRELKNVNSMISGIRKRYE